jgi:hypothetical protein
MLEEKSSTLFYRYKKQQACIDQISNNQSLSVALSRTQASKWRMTKIGF